MWATYKTQLTFSPEIQPRDAKYMSFGTAVLILTYNTVHNIHYTKRVSGCMSSFLTAHQHNRTLQRRSKSATQSLCLEWTAKWPTEARRATSAEVYRHDGKLAD